MSEIIVKGSVMPDSFGLHKIGQIAVVVHDIERAVKFYKETLGMKFLFQAGNLAFFDCDGVRLLLDVPEDKAFDHLSSVIYFTVTDIHATVKTLKERGVQIVAEPHLIAKMDTYDLWMSFFKDPDNNMLSVMSEVKR